ncbi:hypothetical protein MA16_Dca011441 [Dendrobium catenatum]|uniref:Uncharacterized protein n=1 Tax=Dendrobium catenatum TaxID=906689 RepID=A0A2I0WK93_9ASPA|nr:hypothetical protein MA16_Dca011441 [Dendrobium catenatum]
MPSHSPMQLDPSWKPLTIRLCDSLDHAPCCPLPFLIWLRMKKSFKRVGKEFSSSGFPVKYEGTTGARQSS